MTKTARVRVPTAWEWLQAGKTGSALDPAAEAAFFQRHSPLERHV